MLRNGPRNGLNILGRDIPNMLALMNSSDIEFHLTGSRGWEFPRFAKVTESTDWDFFAEQSEALQIFLMQNGFEKQYENPYEDNPNSASVWLYEPLFRGTPIHIQVVLDVKLKAAIERIIKSRLPATFYTLNKDQRKQVWAMMYDAYEAGKSNA